MRNRYSRKLSPWLVFSLGWFGAGTAFGKDVGSSPKDDSIRKRGATHQTSRVGPEDAKDATGDSEKAVQPGGAKGPDDSGKERSAAKQTDAQSSVTAESQSSSLPISVALLGSFGVNSEYTRGGLGARAGVHLEGMLPYYIGGLATYFFGLEEQSKDPFGTGSSSVSRSFMYVSAEMGLELAVVRDLTIRPYFGLGLGRSHEESCADSRGCLSESHYPVTLSPSVLGLYELGSGFFAGGDVRFLIAAGAGQVSGPVLSGTVGMKF
ncbi:MAG: hypothetical protein QM784_25880 [Polyangiaceae bacterium]